MREDEEQREPGADERPEQGPTSAEDGRSEQPGESPLDDPSEGVGTRRGWQR